MNQRSDVQYRAEKEYKNSRGKFSFLLREIISNSIHAVLIRQSKEDAFLPKVNLDISFDEEKEQCNIVLTDNGEGFTDINRNCFEEFDKRNTEKEELHFHPLGQGRLAIVYFSDYAEYESVYKDDGCNLKKRRFPYPDTDSRNLVFSFDLFAEENPEEKDSFTTLRIKINKQQTFGRAKTFFSKYSDIESLKQWFIETFFPFIVTNERLEIVLCFNESTVIIRKNNIEAEAETLPFELSLKEELDNIDNENFSFRLWLIKKNRQNRGENPIVCFARNLRAELSKGKLTYSIDNDEGVLFYLTSDYFDEKVDAKGEKIDVSDTTLAIINSKINEVLDEKFKTLIASNKETTKQNLKTFKKQYPSLETFIEDDDILSGKNIIKEDEIIKTAIEEKSKIEKKFWTHKTLTASSEKKDDFDDSVECQKLLNSSLHIYVQHRERVLNRLHTLIQKFDEEGNNKPELESSVHELFFKRGTTLETTKNVNHLHNLWVLDDKFTIFSNNFKAQSTVSGQSASDIYIWADNPTRTREILILELKSTTHAHNVASNHENMIAQVRRYAQDFYKSPTKFLNWSVETQSILYTSIIIARKEDVNKELQSNNVSGFKRIPFLPNSFYADDSFPKPNVYDPMDRVPLRIELYSFEDIYELASSRNEVFFKLLKNEFSAENCNE